MNANADACSCRQCSRSTALGMRRWSADEAIVDAGDAIEAEEAWESEDEEAEEAGESEDDEEAEEAWEAEDEEAEEAGEAEDEEAEEAWEAEDEEAEEAWEAEDEEAEEAWEAEDEEAEAAWDAEDEEAEEAWHPQDAAYDKLLEASGPATRFIELAGRRGSIAWTDADRDLVVEALPLLRRMAILARDRVEQLFQHGRATRRIMRRRKIWKQGWHEIGARRWFGKWSRARMARVRRVLKRLVRRIDRGFTFVRWDDSSFGRNVLGGLSRRIWLGNAFFTLFDRRTNCAPGTGVLPAVNCRASTILHEASHKALGTLGREFYGVDALALARRRPWRATGNASNYEGFAHRVLIDAQNPRRTREFRLCIEALVVRGCLGA